MVISRATSIAKPDRLTGRTMVRALLPYSRFKFKDPTRAARAGIMGILAVKPIYKLVYISERIRKRYIPPVCRIIAIV